MKIQTILESMVGTGAITTSAVSAAPGVAIAKHARGRKKVAKRLKESAIVCFDTSTALLFKVDSRLFEDENSSQISTVVNSKIDNAFKQSELADTGGQYNTSTFGLQDGDGNIVRVTVAREEASEFETRLNSILSDTENPKEIAEILYMLKDDFDIVDVDWAEPITEDDPEPSLDDDEDELQPGEDGAEAETDDELDLDVEDGELPADDTETPSADMQQSTVELLQQVIDLLKKETESRAADAELKTATANSQISDIEADQQQREIDQQVELAKVEQFEEKEKERNKHEKLIQRIAKYRASVGTGSV